MTPSRSLIILGSGYTGQFVASLASLHYRRVFSTSRSPNTHPDGGAVNHRIRFDLSAPDTWNQLPPDTDLLWCFPAMPLEHVQQFAAMSKAASRKLVVLGSTSAYDTATRSDDYPPPWMDETAPVDFSKPRVQGEELLRTTCSAIVLRVAGIYGPGRNPLNWIKDGRVTASRKYVNLIHVADLAGACLAALEYGTPGEAYNVSDGTPRTWEEICLTAQQRWQIRSAPSRDGSAVGKRILNAKLLELLKAGGDRLRHPDLIQALHQLQDVPATPSAAP